jgi:hypothetical protein
MRAVVGVAFAVIALPPGTIRAEKTFEADTAIFATNSPVLRLRIELDRPALDSLRREPRNFVKARLVDVTHGTNVYQDVAIHLKGAAGSFRGVDDKPALTINFDKHNPQQRFYGLKKIHLNNSVQDSSYSTEFICGALFEASGVPAPRAGNARIWLNGRDRGFYVLKEGFNRDFVRRAFDGRESKGNFYDGGFLHDIDQPLEKDFGEGTDDRTDLKALAGACREPDAAKRWERLNQALDVDRFASFLAMDMLIWDWDGYPLNRNNYRIYFIPGSNKAVFIPHGMDQMFWDGNGPLVRDFSGLAANAFLSTPQGKRLYRERLVQLFTNAFQLEWMTNTLGALHARNRAAVAELGSGAVREIDNGVSVVFHRIVSRWRGVQRQIKPWTTAPPTTLTFASSIARPSNWRIEEERPNEKGRTKLEKVGTPDGRVALAITALEASTASWRSNVRLEPGRYRFEALARGAGIVPLERKPDPNNPRTEKKGIGAGLRISGIQTPRENQVVGDSDWAKLTFEFEVTPANEDVELVCELRAITGTVWFSLDSLQLVKVK